MADIWRVAGGRLVFADGVWAEEVERFSKVSQARRQAVVARRAIERPGASVALRPCKAHAEDGTRLAGCVKVYVPLDVEQSRARYGFVLALRAPKPAGSLVAVLLAYGERHPEHEATRSVYERAHKRLHGRYPDEESDRAPDRPA